MSQENPKLVWRDAQVKEGINLIKEVWVDILVLGKVADVYGDLIAHDLTNNSMHHQKRENNTLVISFLLFLDYLIHLPASSSIANGPVSAGGILLSHVSSARSHTYIRCTRRFECRCWFLDI